MAAITSEQAKRVARLTREDGRLQLMTQLGWSPFDEEEDMQKSLLLDYLYDNLLFLVEKGFAWQHVCQLFTLAYDMLQQCQGKSLPEVISLYQHNAKTYTDTVGQQNMQIFTDYFFSTFMTHFKLYQYVFSTERQRLQNNVSVLVETPTTPHQFDEGKVLSLWEYEQRYAQIQEAAEHKQELRQKQKTEDEQEDSQKLKEVVHALEEMESPLERQELERLIQEVASAHISSASHSIRNDIAGSSEQLDFFLQQNCLPRPQVLGPPPKHQTKETPPTSAKSKSKQPKSPSVSASRSKSRTTSRTKSRVK